MKKILWIVFLIALSVGSSASADDVDMNIVLKNADDFYYLHYKEAVSIEESNYFEIGFRVCKIPEEMQGIAGVRLIRYDVVLTNMSGHVMKDLRFKAHLKEPLQVVLAAANWYNEPMTLYALGHEAGASTVIYTWTPFVVLRDLENYETIELGDFYDMLLEITWKGGREIVRLDSFAAKIPEIVNNALEELEPLDEAELNSMCERKVVSERIDCQLDNRTNNEVE